MVTAPQKLFKTIPSAVEQVIVVSAGFWSRRKPAVQTQERMTAPNDGEELYQQS